MSEREMWKFGKVFEANQTRSRSWDVPIPHSTI